MYFTRFDSRDISPSLFVDRDRDQEWLRQGLDAYLKVQDAIVGRAYCILGSKGVGKTILARRVLEDLRKIHSGKTLFIEVDCRRLANSRAVFNAIAQHVVEELLKLQRAGATFPKELIDAAKVVTAITRFTDVELRVAHEHILQYKASLSAGPKLHVLEKLGASFGISLEWSEKQVRSLSGSVRFDEAGLCAALKELFRDIRQEHLNVVLFVDNIDELQHDYKDESTRRAVWQQAEWVIELSQAPIAMISCMRSYYAGIARAISYKRALSPLPENYLLGIIERRMKEEPPDIRKEFDRAALQSMANRVVRGGPTPLACLQWFQAFAEADAFDSETQKKTLQDFIRAEYANIPFDVLERVVAEFRTPLAEVDRARLLDACGGSDSELAALQDRQVVLPTDFWNPLRFTLDPSLYILHPNWS